MIALIVIYCIGYVFSLYGLISFETDRDFKISTLDTDKSLRKGLLFTVPLLWPLFFLVLIAALSIRWLNFISDYIIYILKNKIND
jgi:hypothetical protein